MISFRLLLFWPDWIFTVFNKELFDWLDISWSRAYLVLNSISRVSVENEWNIFQCEKRNFVSPSVHVMLCLLYKRQRNAKPFPWKNFQRLLGHRPRLEQRWALRARRRHVFARKLHWYFIVLYIILAVITTISAFDTNEANVSFSIILTISLVCKQLLTKKALPAGSTVITAIPHSPSRRQIASNNKTDPISDQRVREKELVLRDFHSHRCLKLSFCSGETSIIQPTEMVIFENTFLSSPIITPAWVVRAPTRVGISTSWMELSPVSMSSCLCIGGTLHMKVIYWTAELLKG